MLVLHSFSHKIMEAGVADVGCHLGLLLCSRPFLSCQVMRSRYGAALHLHGCWVSLI